MNEKEYEKKADYFFGPFYFSNSLQLIPSIASRNAQIQAFSHDPFSAPASLLEN